MQKLVKSDAPKLPLYKDAPGVYIFITTAIGSNLMNLHPSIKVFTSLAAALAHSTFSGDPFEQDTYHQCWIRERPNKFNKHITMIERIELLPLDRIKF